MGHGIQPADLGFFSTLAGAASLSAAARELGVTLPAAVAASGLAALVIGIVGTTWGMIRATNAEADAVREADDAALVDDPARLAIQARDRENLPLRERQLKRFAGLHEAQYTGAGAICSRA